MSAPSPPNQKTADSSPYSSLRSSAPADQPDTPPTPHAPPAAAPSSFAAEFAKLQELREALWEAFKAGPDAGLPTMLIELTNCYTNTLRFQMNMKCLGSRKPALHLAQQQPAASRKQS